MPTHATYALIDTFDISQPHALARLLRETQHKRLFQTTKTTEYSRMNKPQPPGFRGPYRRRRIIWFLLSVTAIGLFYLSRHPDSSIFGSWSLPAYLKDIGLSNSSSPARLVSDAKLQAGKPRVQEIDGLLHFVIAYPDRRLNEEGDEIAVKGLGSVRVDPEEPVDLKVYSPNGDGDWEQHVKNLRDNHPLVVFSKTYCP